MSSHLAPQRFVEAIDGTLAPAEQEHLRACAACLGEVDELRAVLREVEATTPAMDPSPLFWDHLGERVRAATAATPVGPSWWAGAWSQGWLRPVALASVALAVVALAVLVRPGAREVDPSAVVADASFDALPALGGESWDLVLNLADDLSWDEAERAATPRAGVADAMIDELSAAERAELVKLLKREMGGLE